LYNTLCRIGMDHNVRGLYACITVARSARVCFRYIGVSVLAGGVWSMRELHSARTCFLVATIIYKPTIFWEFIIFDFVAVICSLVWCLF
jgi:hypothetical protein